MCPGVSWPGEPGSASRLWAWEGWAGWTCKPAVTSFSFFMRVGNTLEGGLEGFAGARGDHGGRGWPRRLCLGPALPLEWTREVPGGLCTALAGVHFLIRWYTPCLQVGCLARAQTMFLQVCSSLEESFCLRFCHLSLRVDLPGPGTCVLLTAAWPHTCQAGLCVRVFQGLVCRHWVGDS